MESTTATEPATPRPSKGGAGWQLLLVVGDAEHSASGESVVAVPDDVAEVPLSAADLRARAAVVVRDGSDASLSAWAYLSGLAGRLLDVVVDGVVVAVDDACSAGRAVPCERPERRADTVDVAVADAANGMVADPGSVRFAKRVVVTGTGSGVRYAAVGFVAGLRDRRGDGGRLPMITSDDVTIDLEGARLAGAARRRHTNAAAAGVIVSEAPMTARRQKLLDAAAAPIAEVLERLGSGHDGDLWNCPRPDRHTHGDAVPSMKVSDNSARCFRCDAEWSDPLRIVADACGVGPDDAAALITATDPDRLSGFAARVREMRAARSA